MRLQVSLLLFVLVVSCLSTVPAFGQQREIVGVLSNFDVWNRTGQYANDFEVTLPVVQPWQIYRMYTGSYPIAQKIPIGGGSQVRWTGSTTQPGQKAHFGVSVSGNPNPWGWTYNWTRDGITLPNRPPQVGQKWVLVDGVWVRDWIRNNWGRNIRIQRRVITRGPRVILEDLMRGGDLWNNATLIDTTPIVLGDGAELTYDFPLTNDQSYVMMYDVINDETGELEMTYLNSTDVVPEPASIIGLLSGFVGLAGFAIRRRR